MKTVLWLRAGATRLLLSLAAGLRAAPGAATRIRAPGSPADPFGDLAPPVDINPVVNNASGRDFDEQMEAARIMSGLSLINEQVDLTLAAQLEIVCSGLRTVMNYESEQQKVTQEILGVDQPGRVVRICQKLHNSKKFIPAIFFNDVTTLVPVPGFPESLGEIVIEAVQRADSVGSRGEHVVLTLVGCTSCENDITAEVEWGGLVPLDENGEYRKMYMLSHGRYWNRHGEAKWRLGSRQPIVEMPYRKGKKFPRTFGPSFTPSNLQKYVKTHEYRYVSTKYDQTTLHKVRSLAAMASLKGTHFDVKGLSQSWDSSLTILEEMRRQARHVPFNHKMEQLHVRLYACREKGKSAKLSCTRGPVETLIVHDGALTVSSSASVFLDEIGRRGSRCAFGPCAEREGIALNGVLHPYTMCSSCSGRTCSSSRTSPDNSSLWLNKDIPENWFNCVVDRIHGLDGPIDRLLQPPEDTDPAASRGSGLLFRGESALARVVGHINWHVTSLGKGHCQPLLEQAAFVGLGVDQADACIGRGGVDLDLGAVLLQCSRGNRHCRPMKQLLHPKYGIKDSTNYDNLAGISDDSLTGLGEGDDEWLYFRLAELQSRGVTHIILTANIYGCSDGTMPRHGLYWKSLEGAFMRFVGSSGNASKLPAARTSSYIDLDEMQIGAAHGAVVAMLYLSRADKLAIPSIRLALAGAAGKDKVWNVAALHRPITRDMTDAVKDLSNLVTELHELSAEKQVATMDLDARLTTGQELPGQTDQLRELIQDAARHQGYSKSVTSTPAEERTDEQRAQAMLPQDFWNRVGWVLPGGLPSADVQCIAV